MNALRPDRRPIPEVPLEPSRTSSPSDSFRKYLTNGERKVKRIRAPEIEMSTIRVAQDKFANAYKVVYGEANKSIKYFSFYFGETASAKMVQQNSLDVLFDRNVENLTKSSTFADVFRTRAVT